MAEIGILTLSEPGHINPTIRLRNELLELGHDVRYFVDNYANGEEDRYTERGLPVVRIVYEPDGSVRIPPFIPEVVLIEAVLVTQAILAWHHEVPTIKFSSTFSQRYDPRLPPLTSGLLPDASGSFPEAFTAEAWRAEHERKSPWKEETWGKHCADFARARGFPGHWLDDRAAIDLTFKFPELNLNPQELDFQRSDDDLFYAGPCVELSRPALSQAGIAGLPSDRPIIYCSFGTQTQRYPNLLERVRLVAESARLLPDMHFVLSWDGEAPPNLPPNFVAMRNAPQLALLRRASLMLTHGGIGSIKEALCLGVPPVVLPFDLDQPGNAARVQHLNCGRQASWDSSAASLAAVIREALHDEVLGRRVQTLRKRFQEALDDRTAAKAFQRCVERSKPFCKQGPAQVFAHLV